jgi:hypothetical protein
MELRAEALHPRDGLGDAGVMAHAAATTLTGSPFRGLAPLRYVDEPIFFGRDRETQLLHRLVVIYRGVLLYGDSGTGKSSLLNAGLIPAAERELMRPERVRVQPQEGGELFVERISMGVAGLPPYLPSALVDDDSPSAVYSVPAFRRRIAEAAEGATPLLIFDQFEELVTLFQASPGREAHSQRRRLQQSVAEMLHDVLNDASLPVKLLFAFREDYLAKLLDFLPSHTELKSQYVRLTPPGPDALRTIVRGPFERFPGTFDPPFPPSLADRLVDEVMDRGEAGSGGRLSELQVACGRLWRSPEPEHLLTERGLQALLEDELSASIDRFDAGARATAIALLSHLVTPSGSRNVVSQEDLIERLQEETGTSPVAIQETLSSLEHDARLIRREVRHDVAFYEIVSEFLVPWIARRRSRLEISRVQDAEAPDPTTFALGRLGDVAGPTPAPAAWREHALTRIAELDAVAAASEGSNGAARNAMTQHLEAARAVIEQESDVSSRRRFSSWLRGSTIERAAANIDAAEADLLRLAPPGYLRRQLPSLVVHVRQHLSPDDPRRIHIEAIGQDVAANPDADEILQGGREAIVVAVHAASSQARRDVMRVRAFRNLILAAAGALTVVALGLALLGAARPQAVPLCFDVITSGGEVHVSCPTDEATVSVPNGAASGAVVDDVISATASPWDVVLVELIGMIAAALTSATALRTLRVTTSPYSVPIALAVLKLPSGALTAVLGLLLIRGGFVPGFASLDSSAQIIAWACVFGFAQQVLTRFVDERGQAVLDEAESPVVRPNAVTAA